MQKENYDGTSRVRHVPIRVESREANRRSDRSNPDQQHLCDEYSQQHRLNQNNFDHRAGNQHIDGSLGNERLPSHDNHFTDTKCKPIPPPRASPQDQTTSFGRNYSPDCANPSLDEDLIEKRKSRSWLCGKNKKDRSRDRLNSANRNSSNSDKLVSSPEPIPLPPPQTQESSNPSTQPTESGHEDSIRRGTLEQQEQTNKAPIKAGVEKTPDTPYEAIQSIKQNINSLLQAIVKFDGISVQSKDYRYLDEMLTNCVLNLDNVDCKGSVELRQQRKAAIVFVDQATHILQKKLAINIDVHDLSSSILGSQ